MAIISVENLSRAFARTKAVDTVSFSVDAESIFGFLGPNGAGKTTTINILCTLLAPTEGRASIDGQDCVHDAASVRERIGIVFQDNTLDKELSAYENLWFHAKLYRVPRDERKIRVEEALVFAGLIDRRNDPVKRFSGGMKRRLEVARAIVHQPKVLFLDEPTIGLDPQSRSSLWEFIGQLPKTRGVTIFMTTHYLDEAEICDRIAIIDHGRIIAEGTPDELKKLVGGDVIYLKTTNNTAAIQMLHDSLELHAEEREAEIFISTSRGDACIPKLIGALADSVVSVRLQRPTLNDVFLKLTGRAMREEPVSGSDTVREAVRSYRKRFERGK
ncbi:MAG TPA: ATP-binding cassette domain-containing protein [Dissulfurispiraceae bacterium]|nr:ATP-binding cassette domain-containing protein [Dissulfurispiraceae bacterium]